VNWPDAEAESFIGLLRDERLNETLFASLEDTVRTNLIGDNGYARRAARRTGRGW
jgi:hypothetical protein